jgi:hypothetical protein
MGLVGRLTGQKTRWARSTAGPISELKTKINNTKLVGLHGVLGLNQLAHTEEWKKIFEFSPRFFYFKTKRFKHFEIGFDLDSEKFKFK